MKEKVHAIIGILKDRYADAPCALHYSKDYELMIAVRLSAQCTDARVNLVTPALFAAYPTLEAMADAASSVMAHFKTETVYITVMKNMSVDCDCFAKPEDPCIADIGVLISLDPVAIDQACVDLVYACSDPGKPHLIERIESRNGIHTIEAAVELGLGSREYTLVEIE